MTNTKCYSELITLPSFEERFNYLKVGGFVGQDTFGFQRWINQRFYTSKEWRDFRNRIIIRDNGCDMALLDYPIFDAIYIHHINPLDVKDFENDTEALFDPENVICLSFNTHQALHYSDLEMAMPKIVERTPFDTCPWKTIQK